MKALISLLLCVGSLAGQAIAAPVDYIAAPQVSAAVVKLPQDSAAPSLTLFGKAGENQFVTLSKWFREDHRLNAMCHLTHWHVITSDSPSYAAYAKSIPALPCVRLQAADGSVMYQAAGKEMPTSPDSLASAINAPQAQECIFRPFGWRRPRIEPSPTPDTPHVEPGEESEPPKDAPAPQSSVVEHVLAYLLVFGTALFAGVLVGAGYQLVKYVKK